MPAAQRGLFPDGALRLRAAAGAAPAPRPSRSAAERRAAEDASAMERLRVQGEVLGMRFGLRWTSLEAEREGVTAHYGICYRDGVIRIRLRHAVTGRMLKESSLVDTLCHELAHLRHFDHGQRFRRLYERILEEARRRGYYRPGPAGPRQGRLFGDGGTTA